MGASWFVRKQVTVNFSTESKRKMSRHLIITIKFKKRQKKKKWVLKSERFLWISKCLEQRLIKRKDQIFCSGEKDSESWLSSNRATYVRKCSTSQNWSWPGREEIKLLDKSVQQFICSFLMKIMRKVNMIWDTQTMFCHSSQQ